jgi:hypothetical protein
VDRAIVVVLDNIPLGATITDWMPGVPFVRGEVLRFGSRPARGSQDSLDQ